MTRSIAVALSGGVDSLVAARILKTQGHELIGIHFVTGFEHPAQARSGGAAAAKGHDGSPADFSETTSHTVAWLQDQLDIPIRIYDARRAFKGHVVDYFIRTYQSGRTPNPCLICNPRLKFGDILAFAKNQGASHLVTGHYARRFADRNGRYHLRKGVDSVKDQSYFLAFLSQEQLAQSCFPLGEMTKKEVVGMAQAQGLKPCSGRESQDVCFIPHGNYAEFLAGRAGFHPSPGPIEDGHGNVIGTHAGLHRFTIGQRRGINCPAAEPYYVVAIDPSRNRLIVGHRDALFGDSCRVVGINWIQRVPEAPVQVRARLRYRHREAPAMLYPQGESTAVIRFQVPQSAITPGQGAVFYLGDEVLGGGWIDKDLSTRGN